MINSCPYSTKFLRHTSWQKHDIFLQSFGKIRDFISAFVYYIPPDELWKYNFSPAIANRIALCLRDTLSKLCDFFLTNVCRYSRSLPWSIAEILFFEIVCQNSRFYSAIESRNSRFITRSFADVRDFITRLLTKFPLFPRSFAEIRDFISRSCAKIRDSFGDYLIKFAFYSAIVCHN